MSTATDSRLAEFYCIYDLLYRAYTYIKVETQRYIYFLISIHCQSLFHVSISSNIQSMIQFIHLSVITSNPCINSSINQF